MSATVAGSLSPAPSTARLRSSTHARQRGLRPVTRRGKKRGKLDDEPAYDKCGRHRLRLEAEIASDASNGLPAGDHWSTWDQTTTKKRHQQAEHSPAK